MLATGGALMLELVGGVVLLVARGAINDYGGAEITVLLAVGLVLHRRCACCTPGTAATSGSANSSTYR